MADIQHFINKFNLTKGELMIFYNESEAMNGDVSLLTGAEKNINEALRLIEEFVIVNEYLDEKKVVIDAPTLDDVNGTTDFIKKCGYYLQKSLRIIRALTGHDPGTLARAFGFLSTLAVLAIYLICLVPAITIDIVRAIPDLWIVNQIPKIVNTLFLATGAASFITMTVTTLLNSIFGMINFIFSLMFKTDFRKAGQTFGKNMSYVYERFETLFNLLTKTDYKNEGTKLKKSIDRIKKKVQKSDKFLKKKNS